DHAEVRVGQLGLVGVGEGPQERVDLHQVQHAAVTEKGGDHLSPAVDVRKPVERTDTRVHDVEGAAAERSGRVVHVGDDEFGTLGEARVARQPAGDVDRRRGEVDAGDRRASPRPRQGVGAEMALQVHELDATRVDAELVALERPQVVTAAAERAQVVEARRRVARGSLVPPRPVGQDPPFAHLVSWFETSSTTASMGTRACSMVSRSRMVTAWSSSDSKSTVTHSGVPISSCLPYRRPMDWVSSYSVMKCGCSRCSTSRATGLRLSLRDSGRTATW